MSASSDDEPRRIGETVKPLVKRVEEMAAKDAALRAKEPDRPALTAEQIATWEAKQKAEFLKYRAELWEGRMPARFGDATLNGVEDKGTRTMEDLRAWCDDPMGRNLVMLGPVGVGKTYIAVAACREVFMTGQDVEFWPVVELLDALRPDGGVGDWRTLAQVDVLVLDDLGAERTSDWTSERLYALVNRRWLDQRPTIATSNLDAADLKEAIGDRMFSRLAKSGAVTLGLTGDDRRGVFK
jgi:DNA replication protein DnaC